LNVCLHGINIVGMQPLTTCQGTVSLDGVQVRRHHVLLCYPHRLAALRGSGSFSAHPTAFVQCVGLLLPSCVILNFRLVRPSAPKLHGRFLHITDMHPDPYYLVDASESSACHRKKPRKGKSRSGYYGTPFGFVTRSFH